VAVAASQGLPYRVSLRILEGITRRHWGFPARLLGPLIDQLGPVPALAWFAAHLPRYERIVREHGEVRVHLLCTAASVMNRSRHCSHGQGYAFQLAYLRDHGTLFPLDEDEFVELCGSPPALVRHRLMDAVRRAGLHTETVWVNRVLELTDSSDPRPVDRDDLWLIELVRIVGVVNRASALAPVRPDEAHGTINKDAALKERYHEMRHSAAST
jgi:hypothetical protein